MKILILAILMLISGFYTQGAPNQVNVNKNLTVDSQNEINNIEILRIDEYTKCITIKFPNEFKFLPYVSPALISINEFEFSEYIPFVKYSVRTVTNATTPIYNYALLGTDGSINEGNIFYTMLNHQYERNYPITSNLKSLNVDKFLLDYFYKSKIIYISSDGKKIATGSIFNTGENEYGNPIWNQQIDIFYNNNLIYSYSDNEDNYIYSFSMSDELFSFQDTLITEHGIIDYLNNKVFKIDVGDTQRSLRGELKGNDNVICVMDYKESKLYICSLDKASIDYVINIPEKIEINQCLNGEDLLVTFYEDENEKYHSSTYLINLDTFDMKFLGKYFRNPILSPDKEYVAYVKVNGSGRDDFISNLNNLDEMEDGFYIKNLKTNETIFYSFDSKYINSNRIGYFYDVINWVNKEGVEGLLNFDAY